MNEKGITLISLIITIIITIIISGVTITASLQNFNQTNKDKEQAELVIIGNAMLQTKVKYEIAKESLNNLPGRKIEQSTYEEINTVLEKQGLSLAGTVDEYYMLTPENGLDKIGVENTADTYVVNFGTGEVFNYTKQKSKDGSILYCYAYNN